MTHPKLRLLAFLRLMELIQLLLPASPAIANVAKSQAEHAQVKSELTEKFGGVTAYTRSPAEGRWKRADSEERDDVIVYEVMAARLDPVWWRHYRRELEVRFEQEEILIRAWPVFQL